MDIFTKYAKTKIAMKKLELDLREMEIELKETMEDGFSHKTSYGTISKYTTKRWSYDDGVKSTIKDIQAQAQENGQAKQLETVAIRYVAPKGL